MACVGCSTGTCAACGRIESMKLRRLARVSSSSSSSATPASAAARRTELLESMLDMNIPIPLSSFSRIGDRYVLFGAVRRDCTLDAVVTELATLAENAVDALEAMQDYFK